MKKAFAALVTAGLITSFATTASAHVVVTPSQATAGTFQQYRVLVAAEKDPNTVKLRLEMPSRVKLLLMTQIDGWKYEIEKDENGNAKALVWTATAGGTKKGEFADFSFVGMNSKEETEVAWKAVQTYADGTKDEWTGEKGTDMPASFVSIKAPSTNVDHHGNALQPGQVDKGHAEGEEDHPVDENGNTIVSADEAAAGKTAETTGTSNDLSLYLSGAALLVALASLVMLFRKRA